jgi:hypothetical protein
MRSGGCLMSVRSLQMTFCSGRVMRSWHKVFLLTPWMPPTALTRSLPPSYTRSVPRRPRRTPSPSA